MRMWMPTMIIRCYPEMEEPDIRWRPKHIPYYRSFDKHSYRQRY